MQKNPQLPMQNFIKIQNLVCYATINGEEKGIKLEDLKATLNNMINIVNHIIYLCHYTVLSNNGSSLLNSTCALFMLHCFTCTFF